MKKTLIIAKKEFLNILYSPSAILFLLLFLLINLFSFFYVENFFGRGVADMRPFFNQMPVLLLFLAAAFTMRLWAGERESGTIELLLTLPVSALEVVIGKFLAGLALVSIAILATLPLPLMVAALGPLDTGPLVSGYLGTLLLASFYLSLGLLVSGICRNQLPALLLTCTLGGFFWLLGELPHYFSLPPALDAFCLAIGSGSRLANMKKGLIDLRDIIYYLSFTALFLSLNVFSIQKSAWSYKKALLSHRRKVITMALIILNIIAINILFYPIKSLRADITEWREYSLSLGTKKLLERAEEPLLIRGYFSQKTHPLLEPLLPQIEDFLDEFKLINQDFVQVEFIDPAQNPQAEEEAQNVYGIRSLPFRFASRYSDSLVSAYFHILIRYGDAYEVLDFNQLVQVEQSLQNGTQIGLHNLEYQIAGAIKKSIKSFNSLENICQKLSDSVSLILLSSPETLPAELAPILTISQKVAGELVERCGGTVTFSEVNPYDKDSGITPQALYDNYNLRPLRLGDNQPFFFHFLITGANWHEVLTLSDFQQMNALKREITNVLKKKTPAFLRHIAIIKNMRSGQQAGAKNYNAILNKLAKSYAVELIPPPKLKVPLNIDVVIWPEPEEVTAETALALDQFLMRGGTLIMSGGNYHFSPELNGGLTVQKRLFPLAGQLAHYGVASADSVVLDVQNSSFPVPTVRKVGDLELNEMQLAPYPPFVLVRGSGLSRENPATAALNIAVMPWSSPIGCQKSVAGAATSCQVLLKSSPQSWEDADFNANPNFAAFPELGFGPKDYPPQELPLAIMITGRFSSYFTPERLKEKQMENLPFPIISKASQEGKLIIFGSSAFFDDLVLAIIKETGGAYLANLQLLQNLVDLALEDPELLAIGSHERFARLLMPMERKDKIRCEFMQFLWAFVIAFTLFAWLKNRHKKQKPFITRPEAKNA